MATADGVVADAGSRGPNGNMVTLRHAGGYITKYLHLSRIPSEIRPGRRVTQRDVIGFVGSTGVSTGAHLDYRLSRHGMPLNPRTRICLRGPRSPRSIGDSSRRAGRVGVGFERPERSSPTRAPTSRIVVDGSGGS